MIYPNPRAEWKLLMELYYVHGIDFPFLHQKPKGKPRKIKRHEGPNPPKNLHVVSIWRHR